MYDLDRDRKLNKVEYEAYLRGIGEWGKGPYADVPGVPWWDELWPKECKEMGSGTDGIGFEAFEVGLTAFQSPLIHL